MLSFAFWNLMGNQADGRDARKVALSRHLTGLAATCNVDVVILVESPFGHQEVVDALDAGSDGVYHWPSSTSVRVHVYTRLPRGSIVDRFNEPLPRGRLTIRRIRLVSRKTLLLAAAHCHAPLYGWTPTSQLGEASLMAAEIARQEDIARHRRTLLVGDLNMNPFDPGLTTAHGLNAVMTKELASQQERVVAGNPYRYFYNPMWGHFGDRIPGSPGTYFDAGGPESTQWHIPDQVLVRPALMKSIDDPRILTEIAGVSLVTEARRPRTVEGSDHLPLLFRLRVQ